MFRQITQTLRKHWKPLLITSLLYKFLTVIFLAPLVTLPLQLALGLSSDQVLTDQDIAFFFATPLGATSLIVGISLFISIAASELTALMAILASHQTSPSPMAAIQHAYRKKGPIFRVTARATIVLLAITLPFLAIAGLVYRAMLSEFDINFYLQQNPPEFKIAVGIGIVLVVIWVILILRLVANWFLAVGLAAFCDSRPSKEVMQDSRSRVQGFRKKILVWVLIWLAVSTLISSLTAALIINVSSLYIPSLKDSITALAFAIGLALAAWALANLLTALLSQCLFAAIYFALFKEMASDVTQNLSSDMDDRSPSPKGSRAGFVLTKQRLTIGILIGLLLAAGMGWSLARNLRLDDDVRIIAHRGASKKAPENTMAAILQAIEDGADWVEIDVQETVNGKVVVIHDSDFMKLSSNPLKIWDATSTQLESIDIGSWFDSQFGDQRIPSLREVLLACKGKVGVLIELKYYGHDVDLENRVAQVVEEVGMVDQIEIMSLEMSAVKKMKSLRPNWRVGLLMSVSTGKISASEADFLAVNAAFVNRQLIQRAERESQEVMVWTVNDAASMSTMIGMGVKGIITDDPELGRRVLEERKQLTVGQRLMLELADVFGIQSQIAGQ